MIHHKLTFTERRLLAQWLTEGVAKKEIARRLKRSIVTIRRELKRNKTRVELVKGWKIIYEPIHAHQVAKERKQNAWLAKQPLKNKEIFSYVLDHLVEGWSPEQIAGRLKYVEHPKDKHWQICHETIYQYIYKEKTDQTKQGIQQQSILNKRLRGKDRQVITVTDYERPLYEYLRRKQVRRRKRSGRKTQRVRIPDRVSIHARPKVIDKRKQFGHWEGDSIVGDKHISGLHTEYERVTSYIRFERMQRINSTEMVKAATIIFQALPKDARRTVTLDNGSDVKYKIILYTITAEI